MDSKEISNFEKYCEEQAKKWPSKLGIFTRANMPSEDSVKKLITEKLDLMPKRYRKSIFSYSLPDCIKNAVGYFYSNPSKWLYLHGKAGCGKTTVASGIYFDLVCRLVNVNILNMGQLENEIKSSISKGQDTKTVMNVATRPDILILDDLGVERLSEYNQEWIFDIIDYRYANELSTILISNFSLADLYSKYSQICPVGAERLLSRVKEVSVSYEFTNNSYR